MNVPRRKCIKLLIWICFAIAAQVLFSLLLQVEFNLAPIDSSTMRTANSIKSRLRPQSQNDMYNVKQMGENVKFITGAKLADAFLGDKLDFQESIITKSTQRSMPGRNFRNPLHLIRRNNEQISLSSELITQEEVGHKSAYDYDTRAKENITDHEITTEDVGRKQLTELRDIFISVKTTGDFHRTRVTTLQQTWFQNAPDQVR